VSSQGEALGEVYKISIWRHLNPTVNGFWKQYNTYTFFFSKGLSISRCWEIRTYHI